MKTGIETMDRLNDLEFEDMFDYNFSVNEEHIRTMEDLHVQLIAPLEAGHRMFYRGGKCGQPEATAVAYTIP